MAKLDKAELWQRVGQIASVYEELDKKIKIQSVKVEFDLEGASGWRSNRL